MRNWQSAKTLGGSSFGHPRQEECLCLTIHIATALHLFSACTLDVTSTVMTRMHVRSSMCAHSPLSGSSVNESCAQDTEQKHGKHSFFFVSLLFFFFSFFFSFFSCFFFFVFPVFFFSYFSFVFTVFSPVFFFFFPFFPLFFLFFLSFLPFFLPSDSNTPQA